MIRSSVPVEADPQQPRIAWMHIDNKKQGAQTGHLWNTTVQTEALLKSSHDGDRLISVLTRYELNRSKATPHIQNFSFRRFSRML